MAKQPKPTGTITKFVKNKNTGKVTKVYSKPMTSKPISAKEFFKNKK